MNHLTEAERQEIADRTIRADRAAALAEHLSGCADCAADVARLRSIVHRVRTEVGPADELEALWPAIRARIAVGRVRTSRGAGRGARRARRWGRAAWVSGAVALAASVTIALQLRGRPAEPPAAPPNVGPVLQPAADSGAASQADIQRLLDEIQMEKAMLPPATAAVADSDLSAIDSAIAELREALARDPHNAGIQQMLAESYRQQRDLLKRLHNAS